MPPERKKKSFSEEKEDELPELDWALFTAAMETAGGNLTDEAKKAEALLYELIIKFSKSRLLTLNVDPNSAEEIASETAKMIYKKRAEIRQIGNASIKGFIYTVARNFYYDRLRKQTRHGIGFVPLEDEWFIPIEDDAEDDEWLLERLSVLPEALENLSKKIPQYVDVLKLVFYEGLTVDEAAAQLGEEFGAVKSRFYRAQKALSKSIDVILTERGQRWSRREGN